MGSSISGAVCLACHEQGFGCASCSGERLSVRKDQKDVNVVFGEVNSCVVTGSSPPLPVLPGCSSAGLFVFVCFLSNTNHLTVMCMFLCRGNVETFSSRDSDVLLLKKLLFHDGFEALKKETEKRYYAYRKDRLLRVPKELPQGRARKSDADSCEESESGEDSDVSEESDVSEDAVSDDEDSSVDAETEETTANFQYVAQHSCLTAPVNVVWFAAQCVKGGLLHPYPHSAPCVLIVMESANDNRGRY